MRFTDDSPKVPFRPSWKSLFHLIDLAIIVGLFYLGAWGYRTIVGERKVAAGERQRLENREAGTQGQQQADSILAFERARLDSALADSASWAADFQQRISYGAAMKAEQERVNQGLYPLTDQVFDLQYRATTAQAEVRQYKDDLVTRRATIVDLRRQADDAARELAEADRRHQSSLGQLAQARSVRAYEPEGVFPDQSGLVLRQDLSESDLLTNVAFQQNVWSPGLMDVGFSLGVGLGNQEVASSKEFGLLVTRPLIHRRLGLDLGAGYSVLTLPEGTDERGPYASATLRLSPFYNERFHLGIGARADQREFKPFVSIGVGRR